MSGRLTGRIISSSIGSSLKYYKWKEGSKGNHRFPLAKDFNAFANMWSNTVAPLAPAAGQTVFDHKLPKDFKILN
jgi:hypothetical protein